MSLFPIIGAVQNYAWGKFGSSSAVAQFAHDNDPSVVIDESQPYAELWMGTHPKAPAVLSQDKAKKLSDVISSDPVKYLGKSVVEKFHSKTELPFLFKVLSINKVLSIQAHPDKSLGAQLHADDPQHYPDSNHKPEMAVALTDFEAFCGFKPLDEIDQLLQKIPEFKEIVGSDLAAKFHESAAERKSLLRSVFAAVMTTPEESISNYAAKLVERTHKQPELFGPVLADLIQRLNVQFPGDVGLFCGCLMLNHCNLKSGEAMFLQAKEPHAYISGDIMECMAASDNVIRAGFTPKFKDVKILVSSLTYSTDPVEDQKQKPAAFPRGSGDAEFALYDPPIDEFSVLQIKFKKAGSASIKGIHGPSIVIVTGGSGEISIQGQKGLKASTGGIFFVGAETEVALKTEGEFTLYRAFCEAE
ncbi:DEKNAAC104175 [Brettanomyces naardenensis]|uniref:Mannose-6-phosphate isomerase n=1 Tax=Brettanomyces naardenensis TaxID=13370 RepID=A0A448YQA0_BRENA|nr:DEKNAAC104175 [Brettanomyces naardenensis]